MPARYDWAVQEAFFWAEILDNSGSFADHGEICTPGISAALSGLWRGRNKADNEMSDGGGKQTEAKAKQREEERHRYGRVD